MFGQDDTSAQSDDISAINPTLNTSDASTPAADDAATPAPTPSSSPAVPAVTPPAEEPETPAPAEEITPTATPDLPETTDSTLAPSDDSSDDTTSPAADSDLLELKKQALEELTPLLDKLDQTPEEKFKTTMMMIQATDSDHLIKTAHEAASAISDEKVRAQALLDIVNEINYFTQPKDTQAS